jgi:hypothetical protein
VVITVANSALPAHKAHGDTLVNPNPPPQCPGPAIVLGALASQETPGAVQGGNLPFTGMALVFIIGWAIVLVLVGVALRRVGRRRSA